MMKMDSIQQGRFTVVFPDAEQLNADNIDDFKEALQSFAAKADLLAVDMRRIKVVDSSGLGALIWAKRFLGECQGVKAGDLYLIGIQPKARFMLRLVRMEKVFILVDDLDALKRIEPGDEG